MKELTWDPCDRELHERPYEVWRWMRDEAPVFHNSEYGFYALSWFADVFEASLDT